MSNYIAYMHDPDATGNENTAAVFVVSPETSQAIEYAKQRLKMGLSDGFVSLVVDEEEFQVDTNLLHRVQ